jgi:hypothetical protein
VGKTFFFFVEAERDRPFGFARIKSEKGWRAGENAERPDRFIDY